MRYINNKNKEAVISLASVIVLAAIFIGSWLLTTQHTETDSFTVSDTLKKDLQAQRELIDKKIEDMEKQIQEDQVFLNENKSRSSGSGVYY